MKTCAISVARLALLVLGSITAMAQTPAITHANRSPASPKPTANYGKLPLSFEANQGQTGRQVCFTSRGNGYTLFLTDKEAVLALSKAHGERRKADGLHSPLKLMEGLNGKPKTVKTDVVRMQLKGASAGLKIEGEEKLPGTANYFIGNDPARWHSNIPTYSKVKYAGVYPGVDLVYYGNQRQLEYDFVVAPGADPKQVKLHFAGAEKIQLNPDGDLEIIAKNGQIAFHKPVVYQLKASQPDGLNGAPVSQREMVDGKFVLLAGNAIGFRVGDYDKTRELVIDPTLAYSTYLGGSGGDSASGIETDGAGNAYLVGTTSSTDFPVTQGAYQATNHKAASSGSNAFVTRLNPTGSALVYSTYIGGSGQDNADAITIDAVGNAYVTGDTSSTDFPVTSGAFQTVNKQAVQGNGSNTFITKLNSTGDSLIYSTYLGGSGNVTESGGAYGDQGLGIAVDSSGNAYVTGFTVDTDFPITPGAFQTVNNAAAKKLPNAFVSKLNPSGSSLVYSTYLGGSTGGDSVHGIIDSAHAIVIDASGDAYITGEAGSTDFPVTSGAFQTANKAGNAFVTKLNPSGSTLVYSTYLGGSTDGDQGTAITVDTSGNAYLTGVAVSADFPVTPGAFQTINKGVAGYGWNAFVTKLSPTGSSLVYSTFLGGTANSGSPDSAAGIAIDASGDAYITGSAGSTDFPVTPDAFQNVNKGAPNGNWNAFLTKLNSAGTALIYSTYLGGSGITDGDRGAAIALDASGNAYFVGSTDSTNFPVTPGAFQTVSNGAVNGNSNAFIAKFLFALTETATTLASDTNPAALGEKVTFSANVTPATGSGIPTGTVSFSVDGGSSTTVALDDSGHAAYATSTLTAGAHTISASYSGDTNYAASPSTPLTETIYGSPGSIAVVSGSGQAAKVGIAFAQPLVLVVKDSAADLVPGATVTFSGTGLTFGSATATTGANGETSTTVTATQAGSLTASASVNGVSTPAIFTLTATSPALAATLSPTSLTFASQTTGTTSAAQTVTLTNSENGVLSIASIAASGDFAETNTCGMSVAAGANCTISVTFTPTTTGTRSGAITITDNASGSPQIVALSGTGSDVAVTSSSSSLTISSAGGSATATIQVASVGGFSGTVNLACKVAYQGTTTPTDAPTCSLNPTQGQVTAGSPASATLTVSTTSASASDQSPKTWRQEGAIAFAALLLCGMVPRRRWRGASFALLLFAIAIGASIGCGGGKGTTSPSSNPGGMTGSYSVTVTASGGTASATLTIPLSVQ